MISEEHYRKRLEEIHRFEAENPLIVALNLLCPYDINVGDLEKELRLAGIDEEKVIDYYHNKNLLALHRAKNSEGEERERYQREVQRTHDIVGLFEGKYIGFPVENSH